MIYRIFIQAKMTALSHANDIAKDIAENIVKDIKQT